MYFQNLLCWWNNIIQWSQTQFRLLNTTVSSDKVDINLSIDVEPKEMHRCSNDPFTMKNTDDNKNQNSFESGNSKGSIY